MKASRTIIGTGIQFGLFLNLLSFLLFLLLALAGCGGGGGGDGAGGGAPTNTAPVANAGSDQIVPTGSLVTIDGSGCSDNDGDTLSYSWAFSSMPDGSTAILSDTKIVDPTFTADLDGKYVVGLIVDDGIDNSRPVSVAIIATPYYSVVFEWGTLGTGPGEFDGLYYIAIDSNDNVYVKDSGSVGGSSARIQKFSKDGTFIYQWFAHYGYMAFYSNDILYNIYGGSGNTVIAKYDTNGNYLGSMVINTPTAGQSFYFDKTTDEIYITSNVADMAYRYDNSGNLLAQWGGLGTGDGEFYGIVGITLDNSGNVLVCDGMNHRIQKFDKSGNFIDNFSVGNIYPGEIMVDSKDRIMISHGNIDIYDKDYNFINYLEGVSPGALSSDEFLYASDYNNHRIRVFK